MGIHTQGVLKREIHAAKLLSMTALQNTINIPDRVFANIWLDTVLDERDTQLM